MTDLAFLGSAEALGIIISRARQEEAVDGDVGEALGRMRMVLESDLRFMVEACVFLGSPCCHQKHAKDLTI